MVVLHRLRFSKFFEKIICEIIIAFAAGDLRAVGDQRQIVTRSSRSLSESSSSSEDVFKMASNPGGGGQVRLLSRKRQRHYERVRFALKHVGSFCGSCPWETIVIIGVMFCAFVFGSSSDKGATTNPIMTSATSASETSTTTTANASVNSTLSRIGGKEIAWGLQLQYVVFRTSQVVAFGHFMYRMRTAHRIGSSFIFKIAFFYTVFTPALFGSLAFGLYGSDISVVFNTWYIWFFIVDIPRVTRMAQFVLSSSNKSGVSENVARGMYVLGVPFIVDTIGKICLFMICNMTGDPSFAIAGTYSLLYNIANFLAYFFFYPACLALAVDLQYHSDGRPTWDVRQIINSIPKEESQSPVVYKFKVLGTLVLFTLNLLFYCPLVPQRLDQGIVNAAMNFMTINWFVLAAISFVITLAATYLFGDSPDEDDEMSELRDRSIEELASQAEQKRRRAADGNLNITVGGSPIEDQDDQSSSSLEVAPSSSTDDGFSSLPGTNVSNLKDPSGNSDTTRGNNSDPWSWSLHKYNGSSAPGATTNTKNADESRRVVNCSTTSSSSNSSSSAVPSSVELIEDIGSTATTTTVNRVIEEENTSKISKQRPPNNGEVRPVEEVVRIRRENPDSWPSKLNDDEIVKLVQSKVIRIHELEKELIMDYSRAVEIRRKFVLGQDHLKGRRDCLDGLPFQHYDYELVFGACAENVIGTMPMPVGLVGPLLVNGVQFDVPMATTEGCLIASVKRGCSVLRSSGGVRAVITRDGMTRAPFVKFESIARANQCREWIEEPEHFAILKKEFESTSKYAKLTRIDIAMSGNILFLRFTATTGDAMGMNMVSKGTERALKRIFMEFSDIIESSLSGNMCTDKKPSAVNWVLGRGKSVVAEATIPAAVIEKTLKTTTAKVIQLNKDKNLIGSAMAGSVGGYNAQAANIVAAIFIATGQDAAQVVCSSNCLTDLQAAGPEGKDLYITVTMPSIEVGTVGGGTILSPQSAMLRLLDVKGSQPHHPGANARQLAMIVASTVLAGELNLIAALANEELVKSHMRHNRSSVTLNSMSSMVGIGNCLNR